MPKLPLALHQRAVLSFYRFRHSTAMTQSRKTNYDTLILRKRQLWHDGRRRGSRPLRFLTILFFESEFGFRHGIAMPLPFSC